jgi:hypothetical protein
MVSALLQEQMVRLFGVVRCVPLQLPVIGLVDALRKACDALLTFMNVTISVATLWLATIYMREFGWQRTIIALGLFAQPGEEGLAVESQYRCIGRSWMCQ